MSSFWASRLRETLLQSRPREILQSRAKEILQSRPREMRERLGWEGEAVPLVRKKRATRRPKINWETFQNFRGSEQEREPFQLPFIKTPREGAHSIFSICVWETILNISRV